MGLRRGRNVHWQLPSPVLSTRARVASSLGSQKALISSAGLMKAPATSSCRIWVVTTVWRCSREREVFVLSVEKPEGVR